MNSLGPCWILLRGGFRKQVSFLECSSHDFEEITQRVSLYDGLSHLSLWVGAQVMQRVSKKQGKTRETAPVYTAVSGRAGWENWVGRWDGPCF